MSHPSSGKGKAATWLFANAGHNGDDCLIWPFSRQPTGYGALGYHRKQLYAHRFMCEIVHGSPPSPTHEAAHSCGNGNLGCVNPRHLSWKTISENAFDSRRHGTQARNKTGNRGKLNDEQVDEIRALKGRATQAAIASQFGVSQSTVRDIFTGRSRSRPRTIERALSPSEVLEIRRIGRSKPLKEVAAIIGVGIGTVQRVRAGKSYRDIR